ncbi:hypothetical protein [Catalinimonas niigatensis]|uniref:hypothetical protein n=1 Tax=Catalinimonas niigatensis TaxID=1397264 RepID=UPI00266613CC|nr:hypothetical protein [Catalinimonas niigatensis]WPP50813.1 hypothetical protein PZB72_00195 [Catalinimonas niigatensis]
MFKKDLFKIKKIYDLCNCWLELNTKFTAISEINVCPMKNFDYKRRKLFSIGPHLIGLLFITAGLFAIASPVIFKSEIEPEKAILVGAAAITIGLMVVTSYSGTTFNFEEKKVKEYTSFCSYKIGEWSSLPDILLVKVVSHSYHATNTPNGISPTFSGYVNVYKVLLYANHPTPEFSFLYASNAQAMKEAKLLATHLHAELEISDLMV